MYPDENLVRILSNLEEINCKVEKKKALDLGAGSGRHCILLMNYGYEVTALDYSKESISRIKNWIPNLNALHIESPPYPFPAASFDLIVAWGVLHYNSEDNTRALLKEIKRILKPNGFFTGTLRRDNDTSISGGRNSQIQIDDLRGGRVRKFSLEEVHFILKDFKNVRIGYMERTPLGKLEERISHFYFLAENE